ncbi:undecaprenyl-phosphate glucose phosphotransferase [Rhizobium sp. TRM95796]|uniref:undecaprenyl-phosphate glucose phosphotransferase n=1 Tax=Rhizobium sp. TRM95796 TaxID=2979862 RepID=UPI0021E90B47|nr:undecaprenyl-phosphate glucose phosphotransferase [Rhizobium sp. TRM95796]MCV3765341.1 undecaprenyl-phosphate glucose phosphotransferase [Rhizobium sp. TRM95796]
MTQPDKQSEIDIDALRRQVSEGSIDAAAAGDARAELNDFAKRVAAQYRDDKYSPSIMRGMFRLLDFLMLALAGGIANFGLRDGGAALAQSGMTFLAAGFAVLSMQALDAYVIQNLRTPGRMAWRNAAGWLIGFTATLGIDELVLGDLGPGAIVLWFGLGLAYLAVARISLAMLLRHWLRNGILERRAVVVCGGKPAQDLIRSLESQADNDIRILGIFDDRLDHRSPELIAGYPKLGTVAELVEFTRLARVDMLIISLPLTAEQRILQLLRKLWILPVDIRIAAHSSKLRFRPRAYSHIGRMAMLDVFDKPIRDWDSVAKRAFDLTFATLAIACLWPVMIGAAIAVKATSKGPVFFKQKRHGFNNEVIDVFKFRSMYTDLGDQTATKAVTKGDPRVTPVGRFLRKSSIDELPQLFNVLKGDLSLVGPRPHAVAARTHDRIYNQIVEGYFGRHRVKPGVTGWAQINGWRGEIDSDEKIKFRTAYDLYYIENWSLLLDLKILFLTPFRLLNTENAY